MPFNMFIYIYIYIYIYKLIVIKKPKKYGAQLVISTQYLAMFGKRLNQFPVTIRLGKSLSFYINSDYLKLG